MDAKIDKKYFFFENDFVVHSRDKSLPYKICNNYLLKLWG